MSAAAAGAVDDGAGGSAAGGVAAAGGAEAAAGGAVTGDGGSVTLPVPVDAAESDDVGAGQFDDVATGAVVAVSVTGAVPSPDIIIHATPPATAIRTTAAAA